MLPVSASENKTAFARLAAMYPTPAIGVAAGAAPTLRSAGASDGCDEAFVLLRPAAVKAGLVSEICKRLQQRGLRLSGLKMLKPGSDLVRAHCEPSRLAADGASDAHRALALDGGLVDIDLDERRALSVVDALGVDQVDLARGGPLAVLLVAGEQPDSRPSAPRRRRQLGAHLDAAIQEVALVPRDEPRPSPGG